MALIPERWLMLAVLFMARTAMACQFQSVGSVGPFLIESLRVDYTMLGTLIGLYMLPGVGHCSGGVGPDQVDWMSKRT